MTAFDLLFLALFVAALAALLTAAIAALRGRTAQATRIATRVAVLAAAYIGLVYLSAALSSPRIVPLGQANCNDDWCLAVVRVDKVVLGATLRYEVTLRLSSRARRRPQREMGARDVYLIDSNWRRYDPLPAASQVPLDTLLQPGKSLLARRTFTVPSGSGPVSLAVDRRDFPFCLIIGACDAFHKGTTFRLK